MLPCGIEITEEQVSRFQALHQARLRRSRGAFHTSVFSFSSADSTASARSMNRRPPSSDPSM